MNSYLHIKSFLGQEKIIELLGGLSPLSCKDKVKKIKNWLKNQSLLSIDQKKELEMTPALEKEKPVVSTSSKPAPEISKDKPKGPQKKKKGPKNHQGKGKGKANWHRPYPQGYSISNLEPSAMDSVFNIATQIIDEIHFIRSNIAVQLGKFDLKLTKITSDINDLKKNDRVSSELHRSKVDRLDLICNTCDRIERKCQIQDNKMEEISITNINDQLKFLKSHILAIVDNTNQFTTHLERSNSERHKLKDEIIAHVENIHKNYEPVSHMSRHSKPFTEEKLPVKGSVTPFLGV
ncbi:hypothetical protein O181_023029 [Austropuccinia psidii MF-1]|uniref:Uncharacterized protein n=1 Tax=Austropuccinia psidii MF-1 TaxID=1389203 RepID=A0A9Q3CDP4_9BASI|nr:hypothetical protein [Austropuccinia psidii MF-1]